MKVIIVTGTPGTGKTRYARRIAKEKGYQYLDVNALIKKEKLYDSYDRSRRTYVVDSFKLNKLLVKMISMYDEGGKKGLVIDSHLSHYLAKRYVDLCVVVKCELKKLKRRLERRGYNKAKIRENLDAEIFDICLNEAKEKGHKIKVVSN